MHSSSRKVPDKGGIGKKKKHAFGVSGELHKKYTNILEKINSAFPGHKSEMKKMYVEEFLQHVFDSIDDAFIQELVKKRVTGTARISAYRKRYEEKHGPNSDDQWADFTLTSEYPKFLKDNKDCLKIF